MKTNFLIPENEFNKLHRRQANLKRFYGDMKTLGGVLNLVEVANLLGLSHLAVNQRVKKNKLLAFKQNGIYIFPAFQFTDSGLVNGFGNVMSAFPEDTHPVLRLGVLNSEILSEKGGIAKTPIQILRGGATRDELQQIIRIALLFGEHTAS
nr:DNA-binding protein [Raoultella terrigena]